MQLCIFLINAYLMQAEQVNCKGNKSVDDPLALALLFTLSFGSNTSYLSTSFLMR